MSRRRAAAGALLAAVVAIAAIVLLGGAHSRGDAPSSSSTVTGVPAGEQTTTVTRRTLTESSTVDGTLGYGSTLELYDRLAGTFTWLPSVGATIARGGTLFRLDNLPVVLMYGSVPAYRTLREGVSDGPDVEELNRNLIDLGYDPDGAITDDSHYSAATAAAVRRFQHAEGLSDTGEIELGRVIFAPSARRVTTVHVALGQDPPGAGSGAPAQSPGSDEATKEPAAGESPSPGKSKEAPPKAGKPNNGETGEPNPGKASKPQANPSEENKPGEKGKSKDSKPHGGKSKEGDEPGESSSKKPSTESPAKESSKEPSKEPSKGEGDSSAGAGQVVLTTTSTQQLVQLKLKAEQQQLAHIGERAPVTLPGGGVVQGRIIEVGTVASEAKSGEGEKGSGGNGGGNSPGGEGSGEAATIPVTLALTHPVPRLDEAPVSVELVKDIRREVLAAPATALVATAGGGYAIEVLENGRRSELPVTPGMFANGYVQVEGAGLHEGQTVIESE